jgi:hypothetical protein
MNTKNIKEFSKFSELLKLNQKAEFLDDKGDNIISKFYTDLLPNNTVNEKENRQPTFIFHVLQS